MDNHTVKPYIKKAAVDRMDSERNADIEAVKAGIRTHGCCKVQW